MILFHDKVAEFYWLRHRAESCSGLAAGFPEAFFDKNVFSVRSSVTGLSSILLKRL